MSKDKRLAVFKLPRKYSTSEKAATAFLKTGFARFDKRTFIFLLAKYVFKD